MKAGGKHDAASACASAWIDKRETTNNHAEKTPREGEAIAHLKPRSQMQTTILQSPEEPPLPQRQPQSSRSSQHNRQYHHNKFHDDYPEPETFYSVPH